MNTADHERGSPPSLPLLGLEPVRAAIEFAALKLKPPQRFPRGDGHPVLLFPGLGTDGRVMAPLADHCRQLGYACHDWGRGTNTGPEGRVDEWLDGLAAHAATLVARHRAPLSLIGWSLGGIYAREIAKRLPRGVRQVITLGTPFRRIAESTRAGWLFRLLNGSSLTLDRALGKRLAASPPVPTTAIYSRTDGVVAWQACREAPRTGTENVEVVSSHMGLLWHPGVLAVIADRLAGRSPAPEAKRVA